MACSSIALANPCSGSLDMVLFSAIIFKRFFNFLLTGRVLSLHPSMLTSPSFHLGITVFGIGFRAGSSIVCTISGPTVDFTGSSISSTSLATSGSSSYQEFSVVPWWLQTCFCAMHSFQDFCRDRSGVIVLHLNDQDDTENVILGRTALFNSRGMFLLRILFFDFLI